MLHAAAVRARTAIRAYFQDRTGLPAGGSSGLCSATLGRQLRVGVLVVCCLIAGVVARAQDGPALPASDEQAAGAAPAPAQKIPRVTTTVEVHADVKNGYMPLSAEFGSMEGASLTSVPQSMMVVGESLLKDQAARLLSDVVKNDASVGEDYAPVGYYGDFTIRGFPVDLGTGIQINGMTVAGEQDVPLENKRGVEFVKGISGVESGVASAGGMVNFVTKSQYVGEPQAFDFATDHRGGAFGAFDWGLPRRFSGTGMRINLAGEDMHPYVEHAEGWRGVGAVEGEWRVDSATTLRGDFEYQHKVQRSAAGYQLLGGSAVPTHVFPSVMLGYQPWSKPNTFDTFNASSRLTRTFNARWSARLMASYSRSLIDDNVIWPYGAALDANGNSLCPDSPYYFFCPDGSYEVYDYRSPGELRMDAVGEALVHGQFKTGGVAHDLVAGGSLFHRAVDLSSSTVYTALGVENVNGQDVAYAPETPYLQAGPSALADFNHQTALLLQERAQLAGGVTLQAGGRLVRVSDLNYAKPRLLWLPQYAVMYAPQKLGGATRSLTVYANYGVMLSLGPQAAWWVDNANQFLDPFHTRQAEAGVKYEHGILLTADLFRMRQPFFYPKVIQAADGFCTGNVSAGDLCFEAQGHETHDGVELSAQGKATAWMQVSASAMMMRGVSSATGTPTFDNKQVINVPRVRATVFADIAFPHAHGLHLMPGWSYTSRKEATRDDAVSVAGYNLFNLGARYAPGGADGRLTLRLYADNVLNKRYWKDTGANYGDTFIHLGAPTTVRLSAHFTF